MDFLPLSKKHFKGILNAFLPPPPPKLWYTQPYNALHRSQTKLKFIPKGFIVLSVYLSGCLADYENKRKRRERERVRERDRDSK